MNKLLVVVVLLLALALAACAPAAEAEQPLPGTADNEILTFIPNQEGRPVIRIGTQYYTPDTSLLDALQAQFPDYLFVLDYATAAGVNSEARLAAHLDQGHYYDLLITGDLRNMEERKPELLCDLSAGEYLDNYLLSSLNNISHQGRIYSIPGTSTLAGIAFNVDMFEEHGWEIPQSHDQFFDLCDQISAAGVAPFSTNFKYFSQINRLLTMMCYSELFATPDGALWLQQVQQGEAKFRGFAEPLFELAQRFADSGYVTLDDFSASLTQQRQDFWAGKYAMIDYDSAIFSYAASENAPFELGIMPYPAHNAEDAGFFITPEYYISIPKCVEADPERLAFAQEILAFLSTAEGQQAMLADSLRISNLRGVDLSGNEAAKYAEEAYRRGNLYPQVDYRLAPHLDVLTIQQQAVQAIFEGSSVEQAIEQIDAALEVALAAAAPEAPVYEVIATAEKDFTMLETSYYLADQLREVSGAEIALMINGGYFRSNLAAIDAGEISSNLDSFVMKGVGAEDWLTTYRLSGAQLRQLLERPVINDAEIDALIAASGLVMEYAPWNERGSRVLSLTLEDGSEVQDDQLYTVAAWAGVIDEQYISETLTVHDSCGQLIDILAQSLPADSPLVPNLEGRLTLVWQAEVRD